MVALRYTGPAIPPGTAVPLPEGWPAASHSEPDAALAAEKIASGNYAVDAPEPNTGPRKRGAKE